MMIKSRITYLLFLVLLILVAPTVAMAEAIGTWKLYPCYSDVKEIVPAGDDVFVLAGGNLYSHNVKDNSLTEYTKITCLSSSDITHIAWVQQAKRLIITYSDYTIDFLSLNQDVTTIADLANKQMTGDKTINDIYVNGKYAYIATGFGIMKVNVGDEYIADTYNLGYNVDYCYIEGSYIYAESSTQGNMRALLTSNLLDKNNWSRVGNYTEKQKDTYTQDTHNNCYWAADSDSKLIRYQKQDDGSYLAISTGVKPDGPNTNYWWRLTIDNGVLYCADGQYDVDTAGKMIHPGNVKKWDGTSWSALQNNMVTDKSRDYKGTSKAVVDPKDKTHVYVLSYRGLYEFRDNIFVKQYNNVEYADSDVKNTTILLSGAYDYAGNLWFIGFDSPFISSLSSSGTFNKYDHSDLLTGQYNDAIQETLVDSRGLLWFCSTRWGDSRIFCYNTTTDLLKRYDNFVNQDGTTYTNVYLRSLAEDKNGNIWIATNVGPFYISASDISAGNEVMTQHKVPRNDGTNYADYLLTGTDISFITVDKANRKWIGTSNNGLYIISSDCNTELNHFTSSNSALPSDAINDIKIDEQNGIAYISTGSGLCSYQSDIVSDNEDMTKENVYAYPNPVTPDYSGVITIVGLSSGAQIKILTSSGQLVHEGITNGGSYQWNGYDLNGSKVASGVYMVCVATAEGNKGVVTKIGIVR